VGCDAETLFNLSMFDAIGSNGFYLYEGFNLMLIPIIRAFYSEISRRRLESTKELFVSESPFSWGMEETHERLRRAADERMEKSGVSDADV